MSDYYDLNLNIDNRLLRFSYNALKNINNTKIMNIITKCTLLHCV